MFGVVTRGVPSVVADSREHRQLRMPLPTAAVGFIIPSAFSSSRPFQLQQHSLKPFNVMHSTPKRCWGHGDMNMRRMIPPPLRRFQMRLHHVRAKHSEGSPRGLLNTWCHRPEPPRGSRLMTRVCVGVREIGGRSVWRMDPPWCVQLSVRLFVVNGPATRKEWVEQRQRLCAERYLPLNSWKLKISKMASLHSYVVENYSSRAAAVVAAFKAAACAGYRGHIS